MKFEKNHHKVIYILQVTELGGVRRWAVLFCVAHKGAAHEMLGWRLVPKVKSGQGVVSRPYPSRGTRQTGVKW